MIDRLLKKFPYFLDKSPSSNFYKSEKIFAEQFQEIYNNLMEVYLGSKIKKYIFIFKEQDEPFHYTMNFVCNLPNIKCARIQKNGEDIYIKQYENDEYEGNFNYMYKGSSQNIIPDDKYVFNVKLASGETIIREFPEIEHDKSLDEFGEFINLPRRSYISTDDYANTEIPYDNSDEECDYHYMERILYYIKHLSDTPLPVLEIWKLFGIPIEKIQMINREEILGKMFENNRHTNQNWVPQEWEHKDLMCIDEDNELFFSASVDNETPLAFQDFSFSFKILNQFAKESEKTYFIVPFVNGERLDMILYSSQLWTINSSMFDESSITFSFMCFNSIEETEHEELGLKSEDITINFRDCSEGDWYVNPDGDDGNDGSTAETPFKTIEKAISMVQGMRNIIVLSDDEHEINSIITISKNTKIVGCKNTTPIIKSKYETFFKISQGCQLYLQNISLHYSLYTQWIDVATFSNNNIDRSFLNVVVDVIEIVGDSENPAMLYYDDEIIIPELDSKDRSVEITDDDSDADFVVDDDSENPNLVFGDDNEL